MFRIIRIWSSIVLMQFRIRIWIDIKMEIWIWISINAIPIHSTA